MSDLWQHQAAFILLADQRDHVAAFMAPGSGKTRAAIEALRRDYNKHKRMRRTLIFCPLSTCKQWGAAIRQYAPKIPDGRILVLTGAGKKRKEKLELERGSQNAAVVVTNYEAVNIQSFHDELMHWKPEIVVLDECFPAGTKVDTPSGAKDIESLVPGDLILNCYGIDTVEEVYHRDITEYIIIHHTLGDLEVSPRHPFFTQRGWVDACDLVRGDELVGQEKAMRILWGVLSGVASIEAKEAAILFKNLLNEIHWPRSREEEFDHTDRCTTTVAFNQDEEKQPNAQEVDTRESSSDASKDGSSPIRAWGKWHWDDRDGEQVIAHVPDFDLELSSEFREATKGLPDQLQARFGISTTQDWRGNRWILPFSVSSENARLEKDKEASRTWVEGITFHKQAGRVGPSKLYFDLKIRRHPSFSVNGLLVHNSHRIKDSGSERAKKIYPLCEMAARRLLLTGTPILNGLIDIFGQYKALDPEIFGYSFWKFRERFFYDKNRGMPAHVHFPDWQVKPESSQTISQVIRETSIQAELKDCIDLPPLVQVKVPIELSKEQLKAYQSMEKQFVAELAEVTSVAEFAMTKTLRLRQILAGFVAESADTRPAWFEDCPRMDALQELLESLGDKQVIIWTSFRPVYQRIGELCRRMKIESCFLTGDQSVSEKEKAISSFISGSVQAMISNPAAGGTGTDGLQCSSYSIYYDRGYSLGEYLQSQARNYRAGTQQKVIHYILEAPETIDSVIGSALDQKKNIGDELLAWGKTKGLQMDMASVR